MIAKIPDNIIPMNFHLYEIRIGGDSLEMDIDYIWNVFGISYSGNKKEPDKYDEQINSWYEMALNDENEEIGHHAADSLFGFYLRKKNYTMAEKMSTLSHTFDMGEYNEYASMLDIVCAEKILKVLIR